MSVGSWRRGSSGVLCWGSEPSIDQETHAGPSQLAAIQGLDKLGPLLEKTHVVGIFSDDNHFRGSYLIQLALELGGQRDAAADKDVLGASESRHKKFKAAPLGGQHG